MLKQTPLSQIEYYLETAHDAERDRTQYYTDAGDEPPGRWWSPTSWLIQNGAEVAPGDLRKLAAGFSTAGGRLVQSTKNHRPGYDLTFSAPKSVSAIWACGNEEQRDIIKSAHDLAVQKSLSKIIELGLIETRCGKGGKDRQIPADLIASVFDHHSTRDGDPQIHSHAILLNLCRRKNGSTGGIDNLQLKKMELAIGAFYRAVLAAELQSQGLKISQTADAFSIGGVPSELILKWSKRRAAIEAAAEAEGFQTAENSVRAGQIALETRVSKLKQPSRSAMEATWRAELQELGLDGHEIWQAALSAPPREHRDEQAEAAACVCEAVAEQIASESVMEYRQILKSALIKSQGRCRPDLIWPAIEQAERDGLIVQLNRVEDDEPLFSTAAMIRAEQELILIASNRKNERKFVRQAVVEQALEYVARQGRQLDESQQSAVRHVLGPDGVSILEGRAGTGKSTTLMAVHAGLQRAGFETHVVAPSWRATKNAAADLKNLKREQARALAGFLSKCENGRIMLDRHSALIIDEAGMVSTSDMHRLVKICQESGAKLILAGDPKQLAAVAAGDPLSLLIKSCGSAKLEKIVRQNAEWMRIASQNFAAGKHREAIAAYHQAGHLHFCADRESAISDIVAAWLNDVNAGLEPPPVLASRNSDVSALNSAVRSSAIEAGLITGPAVEIEAIGRAKGAKPGPMELRAGDKIIAGENFKIGDYDVNNNDVLQVVKVQLGRKPQITLKLENGQLITATAADLAGPKGRPLKIQHAFAMTIHASQGSTFQKTLVFDGGNMKRSGSYVSMTRHRQDVQIFIDGAALASKRPSQSETKISLARARQGGGLVSGAGDDGEEHIPPEELKEEDLLAILAATWGASDEKRNAVDVISPDRLAAFEAGQHAMKAPAAPAAQKPLSAAQRPAEAELKRREMEDELAELLAAATQQKPGARPSRPKM